MLILDRSFNFEIQTKYSRHIFGLRYIRSTRAQAPRTAVNGFLGKLKVVRERSGSSKNAVA
jgi:hypothetical protein